MLSKLKIENKNVMPWLRERSKPYYSRIAALILINSLLSVIVAVNAFVLREIFDSAQSGNRDRLITFSIVILSIIAVQLILQLSYHLLNSRLRIKMEADFRTYFVENIFKKDYLKISAYHSGDLMTRFASDVGCVVDGLISLLPSLIGLVLRILVAFAALFILEWKLAVLFGTLGIVVFLVARTLRNYLKNLHVRTQESESKVRSFSQEIIENLLVVNVFDASKSVTNKFKELIDDLNRNKWRRASFQSVASALLALGFRFAYMLTCIVCSFRLLDSSISFGTITAILQLVTQLQTPFKSLSALLPSYYQMIASAERILEVIDLADEDEIEEKCDVKQFYDKLRCIKLDNVTFSYGRDTVLENSSITVNKGDFVVITGISGIGKSTMLKMMLGVIYPTSGEVVFDSSDFSCSPSRKYRAMFSYVPQGNMLLSGTIYENITFMSHGKTDDDVKRAVELSCCNDFIKDLPDGLQTVIGERGRGLSEGQVQRIAIARAILHGAPIMLLDEATSALDEATEERVLRNIRTLEGCTCVIVSHKKAALNVCNKEVMIENKRFVVKER